MIRTALALATLLFSLAWTTEAHARRAAMAEAVDQGGGGMSDSAPRPRPVTRSDVPSSGSGAQGPEESGGMTASVPNSSTGAYGRTFLIPQGKHESKGLHFGPFWAKSMRRTVRFDETALYETQARTNQADINKLFGFADCGTQHHRNSARFGWATKNGRIEIFGYTYSKGDRKSVRLTSLVPYQQANLEIQVRKREYAFMVNGREKGRLPRGCKTKRGRGYLLYPFFGGDETAPHDIWIKLDK